MSGDGTLNFRGGSHAVKYEIKGRPEQLRATAPVRPAMRGVIRAPSDVALAAFRAGYVSLVLEDGRDLRITTTAHSDGDDAVYFEINL